MEVTAAVAATFFGQMMQKHTVSGLAGRRDLRRCILELLPLHGMIGRNGARLGRGANPQILHQEIGLG
jgi:hypothetical protein